MSGIKQKSDKSKSRFRDLLVILLCLLAAGLSLNFFRMDLFQTFRLLNTKPAGIVTAKNNTVQRRLIDRVVWDRLRNDAPVYSGDLIRTARLSGVSIDLDGNGVELNENTLVRITTSDGISGIEVFSGSLVVNGSSGRRSIRVSIMGREMKVDPGTVLKVSYGERGMTLQVNEGSTSLSSKDGESIEAGRGMAISLDTNGNQRMEPMAVVMQPKPNARYIKSGDQMLEISFEWTRFNMDTGPLRLEIAEDQNFNRISRVIDGLNTGTVAAFDQGLEYWRLKYGNLVLNTGSIKIADGSGPALYSPAQDSRWNFGTRPPEIQFRWAEVEEATYYLEVADNSDFSDPQISGYVGAPYFVNSSLGPGTWFWRVRPVFPFQYEGSASYSAAASFRIELNGTIGTPSLKSPAGNAVINFSEGGREEIYFSWESGENAASHTIQIAQDENFDPSLIDRTLSDNFYVYNKSENILETGEHYWRVFHNDEDNNRGPPSPVQSFVITEEQTPRPSVVQTLTTPLSAPVLNNSDSDRLVTTGNGRRIEFNWQPVEGAHSYRFRLFRADDLSHPLHEQTTFTEALSLVVPDDYTDGNYTWTVEAIGRDNQAGMTSTAQFSLKKLQPITLVSPSAGASIDGLTALRQQTIFRWAGAEQAASSRFILSRNANPSQGSPTVEINNPGQTAGVDHLEEGLWYWTVEAQTKEGYSISASPRQLHVLPIPLLPEAGNRSPSNGKNLGAAELRNMTNIVFSWSAVTDANAYIFTLYHESDGMRRLIIHSELDNRTSWTLNDLRILDRGTFFWQVEAVYRNRNGTIEQHGRHGENSFVIDMEIPGSIHPEHPGVLYGN